MNTFLNIVGALLLGLLGAILYIKVTSVPEVYVVSSGITYDQTGYPDRPSLGAIRRIADKNGKLIPREKWKEILSGRYRLVPVSPGWQDINSEGEL